MIRKLLGALLTKAGTYLNPPRYERPDDPVFTWLTKMRRDFKKQQVISPLTGKLDMRFNPLAIEEEINCPCHYGADGCGLHRYGAYDRDAPDPSEELAFLEWMESQGIKLPKKAILKNDNKWRKLDMKFNPLECDEDFFIPNVA
jgi:hypothetical protein